MREKHKLAELVGWYGTFAILGAYALVSFKLITSDSYLYQILNLSGAIGIVAISLIKKAKQPAALNFVWAVIALVAIISLVVKN